MNAEANILIVGECATTLALMHDFAAAHKDHLKIVVKESQKCARSALANGGHNVCVIVEDTDSIAAESIAHAACKQGWRGSIIVVNSNGVLDQDLSDLDLYYADCLQVDSLTAELFIRSVRCALAYENTWRATHEKDQQLATLTNHIALLNTNASDYISMLAHDFRTPLSVIKQFASIVSGGLLGEVTEEQYEYMQTIITRTDDLNALINDLVDVSNLERAAIGMRRKPTTVKQLTASLTQAIELGFSLEDTSYSLDAEETLQDIYCDVDKLSKAIVAIAQYSRRFTKEDGNISITVRQGASPYDALIDITNDGHEIPADRLQHFSDRLSCSSQNLTHGESSLGLALYVAKEQVRFNFGDITVRNEIDGGSTFCISIPLNNPAWILDSYKERLPQFNRILNYVSIVRISAREPLDADPAIEIEEKLHAAIRSTDLALQPHADVWLAVLATEDIPTNALSMRFAKIFNSDPQGSDHPKNEFLDIQELGFWRIDTEYQRFLEKIAEQFGASSQESAHPAARH